MTIYVALDVSLEKTVICVMDAEGNVIIERAVPSDAFAIVELLSALAERAEAHWLGGRTAVGMAGAWHGRCQV